MVFSVQDLEGLAKRLGRVGLVLSGISVILLAVGSYLVVGYDASKGAYTGAPSYVTGPTVVAGIGLVFLGVMGIFIIRTGIDVRRGVSPRRGILYLSALMFSLFLMLVGTAFLVEYYALPAYIQSVDTALRNAGIGSLVSGILLILGFSTYIWPTITAKFTGAILGIVAVALLWDLSSASISTQFEYEGYRVITAAVAPANLGGLTGALGIACYIIVGVAAMIYIFVKGSKFVGISYMTAAIGFIIFAVGVVVSNLGFLTGSIWGSSGTTIAAASVNIAYSILFTVAGFLIIAASAVGLAFLSRQMVSLIPQVPVMPQQGPTTAATQQIGAFCPKCGIRTGPDDVFCRNCGAKLK